MKPVRPLSPRQTQILNLAAAGNTDKEIAVITGVSIGTLRTYWDRMRQRYDARSRSEVIAKALVKPEFSDLAQYMLVKLPLYIWTAQPDGQVDFCNEWFAKVADVPQEETLRDGFLAVIAPEAREQAEAEWKAARFAGLPFETLVPLRCGAETYRTHKVRLLPLRTQEGIISKWIGYGRELAENADDQMVRFLMSILK